jgi:hypothetical protein
MHHYARRLSPAVAGTIVFLVLGSAAAQTPMDDALARAALIVNESSTIGDLRAIGRAQTAYRAASHGSYAAKLDCLSAPGGCIAAYKGGSLMEQPERLGTPRNGYVRELHAAKTDKSGARAYVTTAVPEVPNKTGVRAFCADTTGRVCAVAGGAKAADLVEHLDAEPWLRCSAACKDLE